MKTSKIYLLALIAGLFLISCDDDDETIKIGITDYTIVVDSSDVNANYEISSDNAEETAAVLAWNDAPQNIRFKVEGSAADTFENIDYATDFFSSPSQGATITIGDLLSIAEEGDLDNDPTTTNEDGSANNSGAVYFRVLAVDEFTAPISTSETIAFNITIEESLVAPNCEFDQLWVVGAGAADAGWSWDTPVQVACTGEGVYSTSINFDSSGDGNFRFFTEEGNWGSGRNFPYFEDAGYTIDPILQNAEDGDSNFLFTGTTGNFTVTIDDVNMTITVE